MDLIGICKLIALPAPVTAAVLAQADRPEVRQAVEQVPPFGGRADWPEDVKAIAAALGVDPDGMKMLAFMLQRAVATHARYRDAGLSDAVFADTMGFCTRFVTDHFQTFGSYAFTWGWWLPRQLTFREFRFGALEYELVESGTERFISIHIPGDADLTVAALRQSHRLARQTLARIAPDFAHSPMQCDSWMLSPVLRDLLPASSNILAFQAGFELLSVDPANRHAIRWVYGRDDLPVDALAERTSLQRRFKALLQAGGNIGAAVGVLREPPWTGSAS